MSLTVCKGGDKWTFFFLADKLAEQIKTESGSVKIRKTRSAPSIRVIFKNVIKLSGQDHVLPKQESPGIFQRQKQLWLRK